MKCKQCGHEWPAWAGSRCAPCDVRSATARSEAAVTLPMMVRARTYVDGVPTPWVVLTGGNGE